MVVNVIVPVWNFVLRRWRLGQETKLKWRVSEEANFTLAVLANFASLGSLTCRVKPALENPVSELDVVPSRASTVATEVGTDDGGIAVPFWVSTTGDRIFSNTLT
ncbi:hypothetical protein GQ457_13G006340 [Hibiscus cannabinus]